MYLHSYVSIYCTSREDSIATLALIGFYFQPGSCWHGRGSCTLLFYIPASWHSTTWALLLCKKNSRQDLLTCLRGTDLTKWALTLLYSGQFSLSTLSSRPLFWWTFESTAFALAGRSRCLFKASQGLLPGPGLPEGHRQVIRVLMGFSI